MALPGWTLYCHACGSLSHVGLLAAWACPSCRAHGQVRVKASPF
jgi:hypothetical protein